jgi:hypothetical protein
MATKLNESTIDRLGELFMLEVFMFFFYHDMRGAAAEAKQSQTEEESNLLAIDELHDALTIIRFLRKSSLSTSQLDDLFKRHTVGKFVTRQSSPMAHVLLHEFAENTRAIGDIEVADWLDEVAAEEKVHESLVQRMGARITNEELRHYAYDIATLSTYLQSAYPYFLTLTPKSYEAGSTSFTKLAQSVENPSDATARILRNVRIAKYSYYPW